MTETPEQYTIEWLEIEFLKRFMPQILDISSYHVLPPLQAQMHCPECGEKGGIPHSGDFGRCKNGHDWNPVDEGMKVKTYWDQIGPDGKPQDEPVLRERYPGKYGFAIEIREHEVEDYVRLDYWMRKIERAAYALAAKFNLLRINEIMEEKDTVRHQEDWVEESSADFIKPLLDLQLKMNENNGYFADPNVALCDPEVFRRMYDYLLATDYEVLPRPGEIDIYDITVKKVAASAGLPANTIIMYDDRTGNYPTTVWHRTDPEFSRTGMVHFNEIVNPETGHHQFHIWIECAVICRSPPDIGILTLPAAS